MVTLPHLIVDGYNVIHAWPDLCREFHRGSDVVCDLLVEVVRVIHDAEGRHVTIVFDGKGETMSLLHPTKEPSLTVIYTASGTSADAIIEQMASNAKGRQAVVVASRDNMICETVSTVGGESISPEALRDWVNRCQKQQTVTLLKQKQVSDKKFGAGLSELL